MTHKNREAKQEYNKKYLREHRQRIVEYRKRYRKENLEKIKAYASDYYISKRDVFLEKAKVYRDTHKKEIKRIRVDYCNPRRESLAAKQREYYKVRRRSIILKKTAYEKKRKATDANYRLLRNLRSRIRLAIKNEYKSSSTLKLIGCPIFDLRSHLESLFVPGMTWDNYGAWHIDHVRPCSSFDLTDFEQQRKCFHWTNLQPLWAVENLKKGAREA